MRRHPWFQSHTAVVDPDDDVIRNHILDVDRSQPNLLHDPAKDLPRIGIHGQMGMHADGDASDIRLADAGVNLHPGQVVRDQEEIGSLETCRDGLPDLHIAGNDDPIHRRANHRVVQIQIGGLKLGFRLFDLGLCHLPLRNSPLVERVGHIHVVLRHKLLFEESGNPVKLTLSLRHGGESIGH